MEGPGRFRSRRLDERQGLAISLLTAADRGRPDPAEAAGVGQLDRRSTPENCVTVCVFMEIPPKTVPAAEKAAAAFYCPACAVEVSDPLTCGDCSAVICRRCGTPLESSDELGMG